MSPKPTKELTARCVDLYKQHDMPFIASVLGIALVEVSRTLRKARVAPDVQPHELSFIVENINTMPTQAINEFLGLSASQLDQLLRRYGLQQKRTSEGVTLEGCIAPTRWLIETCLKLPVDDHLPRLITNKHFTDNGLYPIVAFATKAKAKCATARSFSACAFLISQAYPDRFQPWQFRHSKQNRYFTGKDGGRNFLSALMWLIETKLGLAPQALPIAMRSRNFLSTRTLQDYGLGPHWLGQLWSSKAEMLEALAKHAGIVSSGHINLTTARGRAQLRAAGINPGRCAVPECSICGVENIEVHHIVRKATRLVGSFDLHAVENLVPLCRHHHAAADRLRPAMKLLRSPEVLRPWVIEKLAAETTA